MLGLIRRELKQLWSNGTEVSPSPEHELTQPAKA